MKICILLHTHSDYNDMWSIMLKRLETYGPKYDIYVLCNTHVTNFDKEKTVYYDTETPYAHRIYLATFSLTKYDYVLLMRDSDILVDPTDFDMLKHIENTVLKYKIDSLRLNNSGVDDKDLENYIENDCYLINNNSSYLFSLYPTIWNKNSLQELMFNFKDYKYYDMECDVVNQYCKKYINCFVYNTNTNLRQHNERYAHIIKFVHILQHGKWTYVHDPQYVLDIKKEFNIDLTKRGFHNSSYRRPSQSNNWYPI